MKLSIVICTYNRADSLRTTLESLIQQMTPYDSCEVLVVDNNSTDDTKSVVEKYTSHCSYIFEPTPGLSRARNTGWRKTQGQYIAYLDDDSTTSSQWLTSVQTTIEAHAEEMIIAGRVVLTLPTKQPRWLSDSLMFVLGKLDCKTDTTLNGTGYYAHGCNMVVPRSFLETVGGFATQLGRRGKGLLSGEEILLQKQFIGSGGTIRYVHEAFVMHRVPPERLRRSWFLKRFFYEGRSILRIKQLNSHPISIFQECTLLLHTLLSVRTRRFETLCACTQQVGQLYESCVSHLRKMWND